MAYTTIDDPSAFFQTKLYAGTGSTLSLTNDGNSNLQPDWVWIKNRGGSNWHVLQDSSRGSGKSLFSNDTYQETSDSSTRNIQFDSNGITLSGSTSSFNDINDSSDNFVAWQWKANGGTTSSNGDGSITATVQANTTAGFSIITYTGNGTSGATIGHGLGKVPKWIVQKSRERTDYNWQVYHEAVSSDAETDFLRLNTNAAVADDATIWNDTAPSSSVITLGNSIGGNANGEGIVVYAFAEIQGYSKFGSYEANNNTDGPFVYTGFKPSLLILKAIDQTGNWFIFDNKRDTDNAVSQILYPDLSSSEGSAAVLDFVSNGVKIRNSGSGGINHSGTYIYMAFAEHPFVSSKGVPVTAR